MALHTKNTLVKRVIQEIHVGFNSLTNIRHVYPVEGLIKFPSSVS